MGNERRQAKKARSAQARQARIKAARRKRLTKLVVIIAVLGLVVGLVGVVSSGLGSSSSSCPKKDGSSPRTIEFKKAPGNCINKSKTYTATFETSEGKVVVGLDTSKTPKTTNNFVTLARYHFYDNTQIFRTDTSIDILQGGAPKTNDGTDTSPGYTIKDEGSGFKYAEGDLAMGRIPNKANSGGGQFFFGAGSRVSSLDTEGTYVNFGKTREGLDVLKKILALDAGGKPSKNVTVSTVTITER